MCQAKDVDERIKSILEQRIIFFKSAIQFYQSELDIKQHKSQHLENIKGLAAQAMEKTRQHAKQIRNHLVSNVYCPYCGKKIDIGHVDHIYPVAKGGLSSTKNMVEVCSECNLKKKDLTLNQFIKKYNLDRGFIERNLEMLKKYY
jgi:5-methylcytosine-specific restriction endonuclease McrA